MLSGVAPWVPLIVVVTNQEIPGALSNAEVIRILRLWKEHRLWRLYSLFNEPISESVLFVHCINEVHRIQYHLENVR